MAKTKDPKKAIKNLSNKIKLTTEKLKEMRTDLTQLKLEAKVTETPALKKQNRSKKVVAIKMTAPKSQTARKQTRTAKK